MKRTGKLGRSLMKIYIEYSMKIKMQVKRRRENKRKHRGKLGCSLQTAGVKCNMKKKMKVEKRIRGKIQENLSVADRILVQNIAKCTLDMNTYGQTVVTPGNPKSYRLIFMKINNYTNVSVTTFPFHLSAAHPTLQTCTYLHPPMQAILSMHINMAANGVRSHVLNE